MGNSKSSSSSSENEGEELPDKVGAEARGGDDDPREEKTHRVGERMMKEALQVITCNFMH